MVTQCANCKVTLENPKHALIAGGVILYFYGKAECIQALIQANNKLNESGKESYQAAIYQR